MTWYGIFIVIAAIIGALSAFYFYAYICLQGPVCVMADRWGLESLMTLAAFLCAAGGVLFAMADTLVIAYVGRLLISVGSAFFFICALKLVLVWFPPERFAFASGMIMFVVVSGGIMGQAPVAAAVEVFGWRSVVIATAGGISSWCFVLVDCD